MNSPALTKTRIAVSALMATATLATASIATNLALSRQAKEESVAAPDTSVTVEPVPRGENDDESEHVSRKQRTSRSTTGFAPVQQAGTSSGPSQTRTKGS